MYSEISYSNFMEGYLIRVLNGYLWHDGSVQSKCFDSLNHKFQQGFYHSFDDAKNTLDQYLNKEESMQNYIMLDGKKIPLNSENAEALKQQFLKSLPDSRYVHNFRFTIRDRFKGNVDVSFYPIGICYRWEKDNVNWISKVDAKNIISVLQDYLQALEIIS